MNKLLFIVQKKLILGIFIFFACNVTIAQEATTQKKYYNDHTIEYNYCVDELGYFEKYQGWQTDSWWKGGYHSDFKIKYENGIPKEFSFDGYLPLYGNYFSVKSKGKYDSNGICSFYSDYEGNLIDKRHLQVNIVQTQSGPRLYFDSRISELSVQPVEESTYGYFTEDSNFIVQKYDGPKDPDKVGVKFFILYGPTIFLFADLKDLEDFLSLECSNIEEMSQSGFTCIDASYFYQKMLRDGQIDDDWWMTGAVSHWSEDDLVEGFVKTSKEFDQMPISCWSGKFGSKAVFNFIGLQCMDRLARKNIQAYLHINKDKKLQDKQQKAIEYLTIEQYEKYKSRIEYDAQVGRHGVKKADGSYLYVPNDIENNIIKTEEELQKDKNKEVADTRDKNMYKLLYIVNCRAHELQDSIHKFTHLEEVVTKDN